jgi:DNA-nicking Smr family endonuclease
MNDEPDHEPDEEAVVVPIEREFDLHAFLPRDVVEVASEYLRTAHERGFHEIRLVHGRGTGVQRAAVQRMLAAHPLVESFVDDPASHLGATLVRLKPAAASPA